MASCAVAALNRAVDACQRASARTELANVIIAMTAFGQTNPLAVYLTGAYYQRVNTAFSAFRNHPSMRELQLGGSDRTTSFGKRLRLRIRGRRDQSERGCRHVPAAQPLPRTLSAVQVAERARRKHVININDRGRGDTSRQNSRSRPRAEPQGVSAASRVTMLLGTVVLPAKVTAYALGSSWLVTASENGDGVPVVTLWEVL
jgi:hypothetical protein